MSEILKRKFNVGIGKETERGTAVTPAIWLKPTSEDYNDEIEPIVTERSMGVIEDSDDQVVAKVFSAGSIGGEVFDKSIGYFLLGAFGQVASAGKIGDAGVYEHSLSVLQSALHPSLTLEIKRGDIEQLAYPNVVVETLKLSAEVNQYVTFEAGLRGKKGQAATSTPGYVAENYFLAKDIKVKLADNLAGLGAADAIDVKNVEINFNKNIEDKDVLGNDGPKDFLNKQFAVEGSMEMYFSSVYEKNYALEGLAKAMRLTLENTAVTIGTSSHPKLEIDFAKVKFSEAKPSGGNNDLVSISISFKGFYSLSDSKSVTGVLTNTQASY